MYLIPILLINKLQSTKQNTTNLHFTMIKKRKRHIQHTDKIIILQKKRKKTQKLMIQMYILLFPEHGLAILKQA